MDTPRQQLAAQILADHGLKPDGKPGWVVKDYPAEPKQVQAGRPFVSVWRSDVVPAARQHLDHELTIHVYGSKVEDAKAENELDDIFDGIMLSIERYPGCRFTRASRRNFGNDAFAGFEISVAVYSKNIYREAVLTERAN